MWAFRNGVIIVDAAHFERFNCSYGLKWSDCLHLKLLQGAFLHHSRCQTLQKKDKESSQSSWVVCIFESSWISTEVHTLTYPGLPGRLLRCGFGLHFTSLLVIVLKFWDTHDAVTIVYILYDIVISLSTCHSTTFPISQCFTQLLTCWHVIPLGQLSSTVSVYCTQAQRGFDQGSFTVVSGSRVTDHLHNLWLVLRQFNMIYIYIILTYHIYGCIRLYTRYIWVSSKQLLKSHSLL